MNQDRAQQSGAKQQRCRLTVAGSFGFGNAGDEAAPLALQDIARSIGVELDVDVLARFDEPADSNVIGLGPADQQRRVNIVDQPLIYVGGGIVEPQDKASVLRIGAWARRNSVPYTALFGAAVEPRVRYGWRSRRRVAAELRHYQRLLVRDVISATELSRLMPKADVELLGDVVLWLEAGAIPPELNGVEGYIAVNLAPRWSDEPGWRPWIAEQLRRVSTELNAPIVFVPCTQAHDRDQQEHAAVAELLRNAESSLTIVELPGMSDPRAVAAAFGNARLTIAMRLHACVMSYAQRVPWLGLTYHPKLSGFAATVEQPMRLLPQQLPAQQSSEAYGFTFSALDLADCDLVEAADAAMNDSSFHRLSMLREDLAAALGTVLEEAAGVTLAAERVEMNR